MTFDADVWHAGSPWPVSFMFKGQGRRMVTGWRASFFS